MTLSMYQKYVGCESKFLDGILRYTILMMSTSTAKCNYLKAMFHAPNKRLFCELLLSAQQAFIFDPPCCAHMFKIVLAL
jgi:hypothetical protein